MPLLKKGTLEKAAVDEFLRDDEEVFHCVMTNEIFRDYEDFAERNILCNSMVWTCSMTGKSNLTYEEALQSEKNAKQMLTEFPTELRVPIIYIATLVKGSFSEMVEDVFNFVKDHYFIGEKVEALQAKKWADYRVVSVIAPSEKELADTNKGAHETANLYKYELLEAESGSHVKVTTTASQMRRRKGTYSREKSKLFLKQHVESRGYSVGIKQAALASFGMEDMKFEKIFAGPVPVFEHKARTAATNGKKVRQETLAKFLSKNNIMLPKTKEEEEEANRKKMLQEAEKEKERERKQQERDLKKQKDIEIGLKLRDWNQPMCDLLLEDQQPLPVFEPMASRIPDKYMGEVLCVMEFANTFSSIISTRTYFPSGISLTVMEKILLETRAGSPMTNMIHMLLAALFKLEAAEKDCYNKHLGSRWGASKQTLAADRCQLWLLKNYGSSLFNIEMDVCTLSEVLRLHLLGSGNNINEAGVKWRSQYRGGFESEEDPAIGFRLHNPHILKSLSLHHVCQLSLADKLKVLECLVNQLLTFKEVRDAIDQQCDDMKEHKSKLRAALASERKRQADADTQISQLKKGSLDMPVDKAKMRINEVREAEEKFKSDFDAVATSLQSKIYRKANFIGYDRAYRAYFKLHSIPAFVVNQEDHQQGACLSEITQHVPELVGADRRGIMNYLQKMSDEMNSSDKENEPKQNGVETKTTTTLANINELLMCTTDPTSCPVHAISKNAPKWYVIESEEQLEELRKALNKRGVNEKELAKTIEIDGVNLSKIISRTPSYVTNKTTNIPSRFHKDDNWGYAEKLSTDEVLRMTVIDRILTLEEKLSDGFLGGINKNSDEFRTLVEDNKYEKINALTRQTKWHIVDDEEAKQVLESDWEDPGKYLEKHVADVDSEDSEVDSDEILLAQTSVDQKSIKFLAHALLQIAQSVKLHFIAKPLGQYVSNPKQPKQRQNAIVLWAQSLLNSTSYSQILLHCHVLNSAIAWSKSTLVVRCKTCKRGKNEQNMLLCDYCNDGYHLYCLRPKLSAVPDGNWYCVNCKEIVENEEAKKKQKLEDEAKKNKQDESMQVDESDGEPQSCFVCGADETEDSLQCVTCLNSYHLECANLKRGVRGAWTCTQCKEASEREAMLQANGDQVQRRSGRSNDISADMPLNNAALQELLRDVIGHEDAWPFIKPVHKHEVPDYYEIIKKPMDFGTIKYKLNMGAYRYDDEVLSDCQLVFENCHTYNSSGDEVFQCGCRVLKYFTKKCKDLKLDFTISVTMEANGVSDDEEPPRKSRRTRFCTDANRGRSCDM